MRQVRRKTADLEARTYLLKARTEGVQLSWSNYEDMLPQDGFALLGLSCQECLQGPCRLNPFKEGNQGTICGLNKTDLVYRTLKNLVSKDEGLAATALNLVRALITKSSLGLIDENLLKDKAAKWQVLGSEASELGTGFLTKLMDLSVASTLSDASEAQDQVASLQKEAKAKVSLMEFTYDMVDVIYGNSSFAERNIGLGVLDPEAVNLCFQGVSPLQLALAQEVAKEMEVDAISKGAGKGFKISLVGDILPQFELDVVTNDGAVEFALLTGLVDIYATGTKSEGHGRNVVSNYHTMTTTVSPFATKEELISIFEQALVAFSQRQAEKIKVSDKVERAHVGYSFDVEALKSNLSKGVIKGVCILGGGSNIKVTQEEAMLKLAKDLAEQNIICLTYGKAATTLGKNGYLNEGAENKALGEIFGLKTGPFAFCIGSELEAVKLTGLVENLDSQKVVAVFPEMTGSRDLQVALALSERGIKILTGVKMPIEGNLSLAKAMDKVISYCEGQELAAKVLETVGENKEAALV